MTPNHLELKSADGTKLNLEALYQIAPSCFTEVKDEKTGELRHVVNFTTLRQLLGDDAVEDANEMYQFTWPGKQEARREAARPISDTLRPCPEESVDWDTTQNLYIEGDNLAVLKLLQKGYMGKVKMIYIDPPYNTGNDFVYHDGFAVSQKEMDLFSGDVDEEGNRYRKNTDSNGRFHSDWCSMMYSRLMVSRSLLREDGIIFISIDNGEVDNLRKICDEVFGEQNFVIDFLWKKKGTTSNVQGAEVSSLTDSTLCYKKSSEARIKPRVKSTEERSYPYTDKEGSYRTAIIEKKDSGAYKRDSMKFPILGHSPREGKRWQIGEDKARELESKNRFLFDGEKILLKIYAFEDKDTTSAQPNILENCGSTDTAAKLVNNTIFNIPELFDNPKPIELLTHLTSIAADQDSIVLDFFSGSATTAHAVMQLNAQDNGTRKYICVQLPEETPENSEAYKAGYYTIPEIAKERIRRAGKTIMDNLGVMAQNLDTGFRVFKLSDSNFNEVYFNPKEFTQDLLSGLENNIKDGRTDLDLLFGAMLDWGVQLSLPMSKETVDGCDIYTVNEGDLVACFSENVTENVVAAMASKMPLRVLFRDSCFDEDKAKINVFELFKQKLDWGEDEAIKNIRVI